MKWIINPILPLGLIGASILLTGCDNDPAGDLVCDNKFCCKSWCGSCKDTFTCKSYHYCPTLDC